MKKSFVLAITGIVFLATAAEKKTTVATSIYDSAMVHLIRQHYDRAASVLSAHLETNPLDLKAWYLQFAVEQTRILDYESYIFENKSFQVMADTIRRLFESRLQALHGTDSTTCLFYCANVYGGISVMQAKSGNWFDGVKNAIKSVSMLRLVKKRDSTFYAADLGLGIFNYYLSTSLKWLPFIDAKESEGIESIFRALNADFPYNYAAKNSLCWILIEQENFKRADSLAMSALREFPDNSIFLRIKALIALWSGSYMEALYYGHRLIGLTEKRVPLNWSDLITGYTVLVQGNYENGNIKESVDAARIILEKKVPCEYLDIPHIKKNMKYISGIRQKYRKKFP
jgi:tetratricopeptide (TPR) repeat protein